MVQRAVGAPPTPIDAAAGGFPPRGSGVRRNDARGRSEVEAAPLSFSAASGFLSSAPLETTTTHAAQLHGQGGKGAGRNPIEQKKYKDLDLQKENTIEQKNYKDLDLQKENTIEQKNYKDLDLQKENTIEQKNYKDLDLQKEVHKKLLDVMDEESLWHLASVFQRRGLIRHGESGLEAVPSTVATSVASFKAAAGAAPQGASSACVKQLNSPSAFTHAETVYSAAASFTDPQAAPVRTKAEAISSDSMVADRGAIPCNNEIGGNEDGEKGDGGPATTMILRNLPPSFDQKSMQDWVDLKGYKGKYDFLLWFPAKKTSRLSTSSYAFVNFRSTALAQRFREENHLFRFIPRPDAERVVPLSISVAKVQGFKENFLRFHHLTNEKSPTLCAPFFAQDSIDRLSQDAKDAAANAPPNMPRPSTEGRCKTLIIRNLPHSIKNQDIAREWLDAAGFGGTYNLFLYLPPKRRRPEQTAQSGPPLGLGYAFVNFTAKETANKCAETLNGRSLNEDDPVLSIVAARIQGFLECLRHFNTLQAGGRVMPWTDPVAMAGRAVLRQFQ